MEEIFEKIGSKTTLSQKIERRVEAAIREKKLPIGAKLPTERELCESFGVSRTALREALRRLAARGLIKIQKGSGMYVSGINISDAINTLNLYYDLKFDRNLIAQIIEVRRIFEPEIAKLAAQERTEAEVIELDKLVKEFARCDPDNTQLEADLDNRFHLTITKATRNPIVQVTMEPIYTLLPRMRNLTYANIEGEKEITLMAHQSIFDAIRDQNGQAAHDNMVQHLKRTSEIYYNVLDKTI